MNVLTSATYYYTFPKKKLKKVMFFQDAFKRRLTLIVIHLIFNFFDRRVFIVDIKVYIKPILLQYIKHVLPKCDSQDNQQI